MTEADRISLAEMKVTLREIAADVGEVKEHVARTNGHVAQAFREIDAAKVERAVQDGRIGAVETAIGTIVKASQSALEFKEKVKIGIFTAVIGGGITFLVGLALHLVQ